MSTVVSELAGALITSAAPEILPMAGSLAGKLFGVPVISRIVAGTMWNLSNKKPAGDIEMQNTGRFSSRGRLRGRALDRAPAIWTSRSGWESNSGVVRLNRTYENTVIRRKQRFAGLMSYGQLAAGVAVSVIALLAHFSVIALALSPAALLGIAGALILNAILVFALASHYKMDEFTRVPVINENNWDLIDENIPANQSNVTNTIYFGLASFVAPFACLYHLCSDASTGYDERARYLENN